MAIVKCKTCSKEFYVKPSHQKRGWGKFCSKVCQAEGQLKGKFVKCHICKNKIYRSPKSLSRSLSKKFFCSKSCQTLWRNIEYTGDKSRNWKNGEHAYRSILRRSGRELKCVFCGIIDGRVLAVHHKDHNRSNNNINNLVWLCFNCHYLVHHDEKIDNQIMEALV